MASPLLEIQLLSLNSIRLHFGADVVINDIYKNREGYAINAVSSEGTLAIRRILAPVQHTGFTRHIIIETDTPIEGATYQVIMPEGLLSADGDPVAPFIDTYVPDKTKCDSIMASVPEHFTKKHGSMMRCLLQAISNEDNIIGGTGAVIDSANTFLGDGIDLAIDDGYFIIL